MKKTPLFLLVALVLSSLLSVPRTAIATVSMPQASATPPAATQPPAATNKPRTLKIEITADDKAADKDADTDSDTDVHAAGGHDNAMVSVGHDSTLAAGEHATTVVSVLGSSTSAGQVDEAVVSVVGNTRVTGPVGEAVVAVIGNTYVDSHVGENVVAVFGNVELGPHADVGGDVVAIGGELIRDPAAVIHGNVQNVMMFGKMGSFGWLQSWVHHCLLLGRPLAFAPGLGWAWTLALGFLGLYLLIALLFPQGVNNCVRTMEERPGRTVLASLFTFLCKPIVFLLLVVTVIGMVLIPFLALALFIAGLFGKAVALAWIGRRVLLAREGAAEPPPVLAVLIGGIIALLLYVVPVLGFIAYKGLDVLGLGIVVYTLILGMRASRAAKAPAGAAPPPAAAAAAAPGAETATATAPPAPAPPPPPPAASAPAAPPALSLDHANRAGFWIRMVALLLDLILVGIICSIVGLPHHSHGWLLILAAYGAVMWKLRGTTIGGIVCGLRVVRLDGRAIDWPTAIARALGAFLSMAAAGLGFIWVVFDSERQSWHDKIAGTVVVHAPRGTPLV